ncbi:MAG: non-canonical purine NTP diphosphatase [bacterium]|jgi:XTP/dITP diphosphohydrolase
MHRILFATNNLHKLKEVQHILGNRFQVLGLKDIGFSGDIAETGSTLEENASIKSRFIYKKYGMDCFSDDTGLEIEALGGRPGVYSARYAGEEGNAIKNMNKVLTEMEGAQNRKARFRTVISLILEGNEYTFEGIVNGRIILEPRGSEGFGYDPVFVPEGYTQTFAELSAEEKNNISHRSRAVQKLANYLRKREDEH